jgi:hypothetical protein
MGDQMRSKKEDATTIGVCSDQTYLRYLGQRGKFLQDAFDVFGSHFSNKEELEARLDTLPDDLTRDRFLGVATVYKWFVKSGVCGTLNESGSFQFYDVMDETIKLTTLMALIERSMGNTGYQEFYEWLHGDIKTNRRQITDSKDLQQRHEEYVRIHGSTRKVVKFFSHLTPAEQKDVLGRIRVMDRTTGRLVNYTAEIKKVAEFLYRKRSEFVHDAQPIIEVSRFPVLSPDPSARDAKPLLLELPLSYLYQLFEKCVLRRFGLSVM